MGFADTGIKKLYIVNKINSICYVFEKNITLKEQNFSHAIICAAQADVEECFRIPKLSNRINVESLIEILSLLKEENIKPIFFSSDLVFDNLKGFYSELDRPNPATLYGKQKWLIEEKIQTTFKDFIIFRTSKLMSMNLHPKSILTKLIAALKTEHEIQAFQDQFISPVFVEDVAKIVFESLNANLNGIYHLAGYEVLSRLQLAKLVCNKMSIDSKIIKAINLQEHAFSEPRGPNNTLNSKKIIHDLGFQFTSIENGLHKILTQE